MAFIFSIVPEYQRVVRFTLGRYDGAPRGPGWVWVIPFIHGTRNVDLREDVIELEPQTCITGQRAGDRRHDRLHARRQPGRSGPARCRTTATPPRASP